MGKKAKSSKDFNSEDMEIINSYKNPERYKNEISYDYKVDLKFKNEKQKLHYETIKDKEITIISGSAGTGKSYVTFATALELIKESENKFKEIIVVVPTVQSEIELGFIKGTIEEKIAPFTDAHLYTMSKIIGKTALDKLVNKKKIKFEVVSFMRGKTIDNSLIIIEEGQNFTKSAMKTLLTRIGYGSKYIISGDFEQCDNKEITKSKNDNGLKYIIDRLKKLNEIGIVEYTNEEIVRNPLIGKILKELDWEYF